MRFLLLAAAVLCLSLPALLIRSARAPIEAIGFWRLAFAVAALSPVAWRRRAVWAKAAPAPVAAAGVLFFLHLWWFTWSVGHTRIANCMLVFSTHPLWTALGARLFLGERTTRRTGAAALLAVGGVALLFAGKASFGGEGLAGDLAALLSAAFFSGWVLASRRVRRGLDNPSFLTGAYSGAALLFLAAGLARGGAWTGFDGRTWLALVGLAFLVSLGGHGLFTYLMEHFDVMTLSCAKLLEPVLAAVGAASLYGEPLSPRLGAAFVLVASGVVLQLSSGRGPALDDESAAG